MAQKRMDAGKSKARVLDAARRLFHDQGYRSTSMRDIAAACGCKAANLYNFFHSKETILFQVLKEEMAEIVDLMSPLEQDAANHPLVQLRRIIEIHLKVTLSHRRAAGMLFDVGLRQLSAPHRKVIVGYRDAYDRILRTVIQRGIEDGCFRPVDVKLAGFMIANMITRTRFWFQPKKGKSVKDIEDFIYDFVVEGLGAKAPPETKAR
jgi:AcrR family transcriptional regulator